MTYENALKKIHSLDKFGSRPGLDRVQKLFDLTDKTLTKQRFIHVAGTNGKGSVCAMLSSVLTKCGYKTGLFISPYITSFRERIQINGEMISENELSDAVEKLSPMLDQLAQNGDIITEFEFLTVLSFYVFKQNHCDIIVCETGLGGLLDSTNVIENPLCTVLTKIDFDHTAILGNTIEEIAYQKCGIINNNGITVSSPQCKKAADVIKKTAKAKNNRLYFADKTDFSLIESDIDKTVFSHNGSEITMRLLGEHQQQNAKTALCVLDVLSSHNLIKCDDNAITAGFNAAVNPARFEVLSRSPLIILDGAHNPSGMTAFANAIDRYIPDKRRILIIGMLADKDIDTALSVIEGKFDTVITVDVNNSRSLKSNELAEKCNGKFDSVLSVPDVKKAFDFAIDLAKKRGCALCVCGSLYLAGEIRPYIIERTSE